MLKTVNDLQHTAKSAGFSELMQQVSIGFMPDPIDTSILLPRLRAAKLKKDFSTQTFQLALSGLSAAREYFEQLDAKRLSDAARTIRKYCADAEEAREHAESFSLIKSAKDKGDALFKLIIIEDVQGIDQLITILEKSARARR
jgi:hypothetical protein